MQMLLMLSTAYFEFLPRRRKFSRLWIKNAVNCVPAVAEMLLRDGPIQDILPPMRFICIFLIIGGFFRIPSELVDSTVSKVADDVLRTPRWLF